MKTHTFHKLFLSVLLLSLSAPSAFSEEPVARAREIQVIDIPTADVIDHYGYNVNFRFGSEGALQTKTAFGIFPRLNLGFGLDAEGVLGTRDSRMNRPTLNVKFRLFDGTVYLPAIALGFDGQGYVWNKTIDNYEQREKGLYLVTTKEVLFPDLQLHLGVNHFDFDEGDSTRGFAGFSYTIEQIVGLMFEWDHATEWDERRINFGLKYYVTPVFTVDAIGRNIPEVVNTDDRITERIVRLSYTGSF